MRRASLAMPVCVVAALVAGCGGDVGAPSEVHDIAFMRDGDIWTISPGGQESALLVEDAGEPTWSPDGSRLAYVRDARKRAEDEPRHELWTLDVQSGRHDRLVAGRSAGSPTWSPDGRRIAYHGELGVRVVEVDSGNEESLTIGSITGSVDWSPDGRRLLVSDLLRIDVLDVRSRAMVQRLDARFASGAAWSPDGSSITYSADPDPRPLSLGRAIYVLRADGPAEPRRLTDGRFIDSEPTWSPDGKHIVFVRAPREIEATAEAFRASQRAQELYAVDVGGGDVRRLTENDVGDSEPHWNPRRRLAAPPAAPPAGDLVTLPDLQRLDYRAAARRLRELGLDVRQENVLGAVDRYGRYVVAMQAPEPGTPVGRESLVTLMTFEVTDPFAGRPFDSVVWRAAGGCGDSPRGRMVGDVIARVAAPGTPRGRVLRLLGPAGEREGRGLDWPVGSWSGFRLDCDYLRVEFDRRNRVTRAYHWQS